jgi:hypothetical protein
MFQMQNYPFSGVVRQIRLRRIAKQVRSGVVPEGVDRETIFEALRITRPKGALEMFGILTAKHFRDGKMIADAGIVGVKKVTLEFAKLLADAMGASASAAIIDNFSAHAQGDGSGNEASTDAALGSQQGTRNVGTQTHGATSNIYKSVATITAAAAYTVIEHGIFSQTSATGDYLLDRTKLGTPFTVATDDEVEWTYELTINTET